MTFRTVRVEDYHHQTNPKARIDHDCCECGSRIYAGETYHVRNGCKEGVRYLYKTCNPCESLYLRIRRSVEPEEAPIIGKLGEAVARLDRQEWSDEFNRRRTNG